MPQATVRVLVKRRVQLTYAFETPSTNRPLCRTPQRICSKVSCFAGRAQRNGATDMRVYRQASFSAVRRASAATDLSSAACRLAAK